MRIDLPALIDHWPVILGVAAAVLLAKAAVTVALLPCRASGPRSRSKSG